MNTCPISTRRDVGVSRAVRPRAARRRTLGVASSAVGLPAHGGRIAPTGAVVMLRIPPYLRGIGVAVGIGGSANCMITSEPQRCRRR